MYTTTTPKGLRVSCRYCGTFNVPHNAGVGECDVCGETGTLWAHAAGEPAQCAGCWGPARPTGADHACDGPYTCLHHADGWRDTVFTLGPRGYASHDDVEGAEAWCKAYSGCMAYPDMGRECDECEAERVEADDACADCQRSNGPHARCTCG